MDDDFNTGSRHRAPVRCLVLANKLLDDAKAGAQGGATVDADGAWRADARMVGATLGIMRRPPAEF